MIHWSDIEEKLTRTQILPNHLCKYCLIPVSKQNKIFQNGCFSCLTAKKNINIAKSKRKLLIPISKGKKNYDCIIGLSGGVDSSYLLHKLVEEGFNPFAIHVDNGWNTPNASNNIHKLVTNLGVGFKTIVLNWEQFRKMQLALINANVVDFENATDHMIFACLYKTSQKLGNLPIAHGINISSENAMPPGLIHNKHDKLHLQALYFKKNRSLPNKLPFFSNFEIGLYNFYNRNTWVSALDYFNYDKSIAQNLLIKTYDYKPPKRKHEESLVTKIYQNLILPIKFNSDKRLGHFSSLVNSGQMKRNDALEKAKEPFYESKLDLRNDIKKFLTYLELDKKQFLEYLNTKPVNHSSYISDQFYIKILIKIKAFFNES